MIPPSHCGFCRNPETSRIELDSDGTPIEGNKIVEGLGKLEQRGGGTEKVVSELGSLFPSATILRMDRDTVTRKEAYREILSSMKSGKTDILVGTQMIAKGHDLPGVTLVGIINADVGLHLPDFRSSEKAFQLITQAAGRSGRGEEPGKVLVQTREPKHPTLVAAVTGRFKAFAGYELKYRGSLEYPPFGRLLRVVISSTNREESFEGAELVKKAACSLSNSYSKRAKGPKSISVLGPAPAPHEKLRGRYRWHILIKARSAGAISEMAASLRAWQGSLKQFSDLRLAIDVDPVDML